MFCSTLAAYAAAHRESVEGVSAVGRERVDAESSTRGPSLSGGENVVRLLEDRSLDKNEKTLRMEEADSC